MELDLQRPTAWLRLSSFGLCLLLSQAQTLQASDTYTKYETNCASNCGVWCSNECESYYMNAPCEQTACYDECPTDCASCEECPPELGPCCKEIEYVDYEPWHDGLDAGLHCLPGSNCTFSCPTEPSGAKLYRYQGRLAHKYRYGAEYTPEEWRTVMLHMRVILPMTACSYRKILSFLQERPYRAQKKPSLPKKQNAPEESAEVAEANSEISNNEELIAANLEQEGEAGLSDSLASDAAPVDGAALDEELDLESIIGDVNVADVEFMDAPVGGGGWTPRLNHVFSGYMYLDYTSPTSSFFKDFNGNNTFSYAAAPTWLCSYGDSLLYFMKIGIFNFGQETHLTVPNAYLAYFYNDYVNFIFGKYTIPFGNYFKYFIGWCEKMATPPLARTFFEDNTIVPNIDIGAVAQGAIPLCSVAPCLKSSTLTYEFWLGNGPSETSAFTPNNNADLLGPLAAPSGTIHLNAGEGNAPNNNNSLAWGGRIGFLPTDCQIYGFSYMKGRWSSNDTAFGKFGLAQGHKYNFEAAAFDWNIIFNQWIVFRGEYIWSQYENSIPEFQWVRQTAYWAMLGIDLGILKCACPKLYWCKPCFWDSLEFCVRMDNLLRQPSGKFFYVGGVDFPPQGENPPIFTGKAFDQRRFSACLGYYFTQSFSMKFEYDFNYGDKGVYQWRQLVESGDFEFQNPLPQRKTGFAENVFTFRIVYGW